MWKSYWRNKWRSHLHYLVNHGDKHYSDVIKVSWHFKPSATQLFVQQLPSLRIKNASVHSIGPLWGESTSGLWIPLTKGQYVTSMSWHHHEILSMAWCKRDVTPLLMQWSYISFILSHRCNSKRQEDLDIWMEIISSESHEANITFASITGQHGRLQPIAADQWLVIR